MTSFANVTTWNSTFEALPPDVGEAINLGPSRIRTLAKAVSERMTVDHSWADGDGSAGDANDGAHKQLTLIEQAALPATPAAAQALLTPLEISNGTGFYLKHADGFYRPGLDGGVLAAAAASLDLSAELLEPAVGQYIYMTPTAAVTVTLPTTGVGQGYTIVLVNLASTAPQTNYMLVQSSDGSAIRRVLPGQTVWFQAIQDTPTTELHWEFPGGVVYADQTTYTADQGLYTIPANLLRADGQTLRMSIAGSMTAAITNNADWKLDASVIVGRMSNINDGGKNINDRYAGYIELQKHGALMHTYSVMHHGAASAYGAEDSSSAINLDAALDSSGTLALNYDLTAGTVSQNSISMLLIK